MKSLVRLFFSISIMGKGPQDVPYSRYLFILLLMANLVIDFALAQVTATQEKPVQPSALMMYLLGVTFLIYMIIFLLVRAHGFANRVLQTVTAVAGVELIIKLVQAPVMMLMQVFADTPGLVLLLYYMLVMTLGWGLIANMHIFRQAMEISYIKAVMMTLLLFTLSLFMYFRFYPGVNS